MRWPVFSAANVVVCPLGMCGTSTVAKPCWTPHVLLAAARSQLAFSATTLEGDELRTWLVQHPPPRLANFDSRDDWDAEREPRFEQLMGERLPLYGDNEARTAAWKAALKRAERGAMAQAALELLERVSSTRRGGSRTGAFDGGGGFGNAPAACGAEAAMPSAVQQPRSH